MHTRTPRNDLKRFNRPSCMFNETTALVAVPFAVSSSRTPRPPRSFPGRRTFTIYPPSTGLTRRKMYLFGGYGLDTVTAYSSKFAGGGAKVSEISEIFPYDYGVSKRWSIDRDNSSRRDNRDRGGFKGGKEFSRGKLAPTPPNRCTATAHFPCTTRGSFRKKCPSIFGPFRRRLRNTVRARFF